MATAQFYDKGKVDELLEGKVSVSSPDVLAKSIQFRDWFHGGEAKSIADCTSGLKFDWAHADNVNRTVNVFPFCSTGTSADDNSDKAGRVVIPPYVDHEGVRYAVTGVAGSSPFDANTALISVVAPTTFTSIGNSAFHTCVSLTSVSLPAATGIGEFAFGNCTSLTSVSLPAATGIGEVAFGDCTSLTSVSLPVATNIGGSAFGNCTSLTSVSLPVATGIGDVAFYNCTSLTTVDFGQTARQSVPTLGTDAFPDLSQSGHTCRIIVPDADYAAWTTNSDWATLTPKGYEFVRHSETEPVDTGDTATVAGASELQSMFDKSAAGTATLAELNRLVTALYRAFGFS